MRYLGLDLGTKTLGVSISDLTNTIASNYDILRYDNYQYEILIKKLRPIIEDNDIQCLVLGLPKNMNNTPSTMCEISLNFKSILEDEFKIKVIMEDERMTSKISNEVLISANMSRKKRKKVVDKMAATIILQSYLDKVNFGKEKENE